MIYMLGMSHAINVLKAASNASLSLSHENWSALTTAGQFFDVHTKPGLFAGDTLKAFIVSKASGWGKMAEMQTLANGQPHVAGFEGFINLLLSLENAQDDGILFSFIGGNEHSALSMVRHPILYDFFLPWREDQELAPGAQPIPFEVVRRQLEGSLNSTIAAMAMMRVKLPRMRLVHALPPPPIESEAQIMHWPETFREKLEQSGITPYSIRYKYYLLAAAILRQGLRPFNVELLEPPPDAVSATGAIKDEYAYLATHANEAYGELVCRQMRVLNDRKV